MQNVVRDVDRGRRQCCAYALSAMDLYSARIEARLPSTTVVTGLDVFRARCVVVALSERFFPTVSVEGGQ